MLFAVSEESHHQKMEPQEIRDDGNQVEQAVNPKRVMTMQHACLVPSRIPTADPRRPVRRIGEATQVAVTVLENQNENDDEVPIPEEVVVVAVEEVLCPGFETTSEVRTDGMTRFSFASHLRARTIMWIIRNDLDFTSQVIFKLGSVMTIFTR